MSASTETRADEEIDVMPSLDDEYDSFSSSTPTTSDDNDPDDTSSPTDTDRPPSGEILSLAFLETLVEAAADRAAAKVEARIAEETPSTRNRRRRSKVDLADLPPEIAARRRKAAFKAKLIIYSGVSVLVALCVIMGTYKLPMFMKKDPIPPGSWIVPPILNAIWGPDEPEVKEPQEIRIHRYKTRDGRLLAPEYVRGISTDARSEVNKAHILYTDAKAKWEEGEKREAIRLADEALTGLEVFRSQLEKDLGPKPINQAQDRINKLMDNIGTRRGQWQKMMTIND